MAINLIDEEVQALIHEAKIFLKPPELPLDNQSCVYELVSLNRRNRYDLAIDRRHKREDIKIKLQNSFYKEPIVRVEINAPPHFNVHNGTWTGRNHIHIYKEGFRMRIAEDLSSLCDNLFSCTSDFNSIYNDFCTFCNIETIVGMQYVI